MNNYKLLALDMDGTLLNREHAISAENRRWISRAIDSGICVMFATGREVQSVKPYVEQLGLDSPMVCVNGSEVWRTPDTLLTRHCLEPQWVADMYDLAVDHDCWCWAYTVDEVFTKDEWPSRAELQDGRQWLKFGFRSKDRPGKLADIRSVLEAAGRYELSNSSPSNIEVNPAGISKASGIADICKLLDISMEEVVACGDSLNDLQMIRSAGLGVAMGNAQEAVKRAAKAVTGTNEEDGVAQAIRTYLLCE